ncbi:MAG: hypothetical protein ACI4II_01080 [Acutalibacteraceae bacterium]
MKKRVAIFIIALMCLLLVSCRQQETYSFLNSTDEISDISIVAISFDDDGEMLQTEIKKIDDTDVFLDDFRSVDCYVYYGEPIGVTQEGIDDIVVKISYDNDEYELINWQGQSEYTQERGFRYYVGFSVFDEEQFEALIEKYSVD